MKNSTINLYTKLRPFKGTILSLALFASVAATGQIQNNGSLYIGNKGTVFLKTGNYGLGSLGKTTTTRTATDFGKFVYASGTTTSGATNNHNIDGYARTLDQSPYILYLGASNVLAPIQVDASASGGVTAAFYKTSPANLTALGTGISQISNSENWDIQGVDSKISLSWRTATIANLSSSLYTIVGYNNSSNKWEIIPSTVDTNSFLGGTSTPTAGSITSTNDVNLSAYSRFTIGSKGENCGSVVVFSGTTLTWDAGQWLNGSTPSAAPTIADKVIINSAYAGGSFSCYSIELNNNITLLDGQFIDCYDGVVTTLGSKIIMASSANFIQRTSTTSVPTIELNKRTRVIRRYDYIYWGTPISENILTQFPSAKASTNSAAPAGAFDVFYKYNSGGTEGVTVWGPITTSVVGRGFIARVRNQAPFTNTTNTDFINLKIAGTANNGDISVGIVQNPIAPNGNSSYNLLSNPYPSGLDANKFITENSANVDGAIYLWTSSTLFNPTGGPTNYTQADYLTYTRLGTTVTNSTSTFDGIVASGQGFTTKALGNTNATFNNCMRVKEGNTQFLKSSNAVTEIDRYKVTMSGDNGVFSQILVGYTPESTLEYDRMYDATRNSVSTAQVYTFLDNTDTKLAINARPSFANTDKVALGVSKNNANSETFVFEITEKEGVFSTDGVNVYLHDKVLGTYHNFANGNYTLTTTDTAINDRFELVYETEGELSNPDFDGATTLVYLNNNFFKVNSSKTISAIAIYDMAGRLVSNFTSIDNTAFSSNFDKAQGVYIAKIKLVDGSIVNQKVINQ